MKHSSALWLFTQLELQFEPFTGGSATATGAPASAPNTTNALCEPSLRRRTLKRMRGEIVPSFSLPRMDGAASPNSVRPGCFGLSATQAITTTERCESMISDPCAAEGMVFASALD
jgi:hypothetical protein